MSSASQKSLKRQTHWPIRAVVITDWSFGARPKKVLALGCARLGLKKHNDQPALLHSHREHGHPVSFVCCIGSRALAYTSIVLEEVSLVSGCAVMTLQAAFLGMQQLDIASCCVSLTDASFLGSRLELCPEACLAWLPQLTPCWCQKPKQLHTWPEGTTQRCHP